MKKKIKKTSRWTDRRRNSRNVRYKTRGADETVEEIIDLEVDPEEINADLAGDVGGKNRIVLI